MNNDAFWSTYCPLNSVVRWSWLKNKKIPSIDSGTLEISLESLKRQEKMNFEGRRRAYEQEKSEGGAETLKKAKTYLKEANGTRKSHSGTSKTVGTGSDLVCFFCNNPGHKRPDCLKSSRQTARKRSMRNTKKNLRGSRAARSYFTTHIKPPKNTKSRGQLCTRSYTLTNSSLIW